MTQAHSTMRRRCAWSLAATCLAFALLGVPAYAATPPAAQLSPEQLVRQVTQDVLDAIHRDKELQAGNKQKAIELAEKKVLPHIDFEQMTQLTVGRAWAGATPEQREALIKGFRTLLVRTYSNAIGAYHGQTMKVEPVHMAADATDVTVRNLYLSPGNAPIPVDYAMTKSPSGWKIYDIVVDGVSLVLTYRSQFQEEIQRDGVAGLIKLLAAKNEAAAGSQ
jgi:phospholipid transport system substrate-binding protein